MYLNQDSPKNISCEVIIKCKFYAEILKTDFFFIFREVIWSTEENKYVKTKQHEINQTKKKIP